MMSDNKQLILYQFSIVSLTYRNLMIKTMLLKLMLGRNRTNKEGNRYVLFLM